MVEHGRNPPDLLFKKTGMLTQTETELSLLTGSKEKSPRGDRGNPRKPIVRRKMPLTSTDIYRPPPSFVPRVQGNDFARYIASIM